MKVTVTPNQEAAAIIQARQAVHSDVYNQLLPEFRSRAIAIAGIDNMNQVRQVRDAIAKVPAGQTWADTKKTILPILQKNNVANASKRADTLIQTNAFQAYATTRRREQLDPRMVKLFPYLRYRTMRDNRVRPTHRRLDGLTLPANDPFWETHYPPWEFNCRCMVTQVSQQDADKMAKKGDYKLPQGDDLDDLHKGIYRNEHGAKTPLYTPEDKAAMQGENPRSAYRFSTTDLTIDMDTLKQSGKYSPAEIQAFEKQMAKTNITLDNGQTTSVLNWLQKPHQTMVKKHPTDHHPKPIQASRTS